MKTLKSIFILSNESIDGKSLGYFRIAFGTLLFFQSLYFIQTSYFENNIADAILHFPIIEFPFEIKTGLIRTLNFIMLASSFGVLSGKLFKISCSLFFLSFTFLWLQEISIFNNHYYFISFIVGLLFLTDAGKLNVLKKKGDFTIPKWNVQIIQVFVFIVFTIAGIAKLNSDWLIDFEPLKQMFLVKTQISGLGIYSNTGLIAFSSYFAVIFELTIIPLLLISRKRKLFLIIFIGFNLFNHFLFYDTSEIGFFPFILISLCLILKPYSPIKAENKDSYLILNGWKAILYYSLLVIQIIYPFRYILSENPEWSGKNNRFAWRMKMMYKETAFTFFANIAGNKQSIRVDNFLTDMQFNALHYYPEMIPEVASYLNKQLESQLPNGFTINARFDVNMNNNGVRPLIDTTYNLTKAEYHRFSKDPWLLDMNYD